MFNLRPGESFPSVWVPDDPADSTTYYPQAIFRNALSQAVIDTVNLSKQSNGHYLGNFTVPRDPSGLGFYITETVKVYTDSGHTALSTLAQTQRTLKIKEELQNFGGTADTTDYNYIEKVVKRIVEEAVSMIKFEQKETDLSGLTKLLKEIKDTQDPHGLALQMMDKKLDTLKPKDIIFPNGEYEEHFGTLKEGLLSVSQMVVERHDTIEPMFKKQLKEKHEKDFDMIKKEIQDLLEEVKYRFDNVDTVVLKKGKEIQEIQESSRKKIDYNELAKQFL